MATSLKELEEHALQLPQSERFKLMQCLIESLEGSPEDSPEVIAKAWDEEIARRLADIESGRVTLIPGEEVFAEIRALIAEPNRGTLEA